METILITGTNRGIGFEMVRQYLTETDARVYASVRTDSAAHALDDLKARFGDRLTVLVFDMTDTAQIQREAARLNQANVAIDLLINNAGMNPKRENQRLETITPELMLETLGVNVIGPLMVVQQFLPMLKRSARPRVVNLSSGMGSIEECDYGGYYAYSTSKTALNMISRQMAADLAPHHGIAIALDPGWVKTDMGGSGADLEPAESVSAIRKLITSLSDTDSGGYWRWDGARLPW